MACLRWNLSIVIAVVLIALTGCQVLRPDPIPCGPYNVHPDLVSLDTCPVEQGKPNVVVDGVGWVVGIPSKVLLWNRKIDNHRIGPETIHSIVDYMDASELGHVKVRANQYAPHRDWKRLRANRSMHWLPRYTLGTISLGYETIVPGRIFGGDHFNPFTQTVHLYSDVPGIAWHELAHAKDFSRQTHPGTYAVAYLAIPLWHETVASQDALSFVADRGDPEEIAKAIEILYPAYGTYVGSAVGSIFPYGVPTYYGTVIASHINARRLAKRVRRGDDLGPLTGRVNHPITVSENIDSLAPVHPDIIEASGLVSSDSNTSSTSSTVLSAPSTVFEESPVESSLASLPPTSFRDSSEVQPLPWGIVFAGRRTHHDLHLQFETFTDPKKKIQIGKVWAHGLEAEIPLTLLGQTTLSFAAYESRDVENHPYYANTQFNRFEYDLGMYDLKFGNVWDSNLISDDLRATSDRIEAGFRYSMIRDSMSSPLIENGTYTHWGPGPITDADYVGNSRYTNTNNIFAPYFEFQRQVRWNRLQLAASIGAFGGVNVVDRKRRFADDRSSGSGTVVDLDRDGLSQLSTGQSIEAKMNYWINRSFWLTSGVRGSRITDLSSSLYLNFWAEDPLYDLEATDIFAGANLHY
jgi:hypothetical protein